MAPKKIRKPAVRRVVEEAPEVVQALRALVPAPERDLTLEMPEPEVYARLVEDSVQITRAAPVLERGKVQSLHSVLKSSFQAALAPAPRTVTTLVSQSLDLDPVPEFIVVTPKVAPVVAAIQPKARPLHKKPAPRPIAAVRAQAVEPMVIPLPPAARVEAPAVPASKVLPLVSPPAPAAVAVTTQSRVVHTPNEVRLQASADPKPIVIAEAPLAETTHIKVEPGFNSGSIPSQLGGAIQIRVKPEAAQASVSVTTQASAPVRVEAPRVDYSVPVPSGYSSVGPMIATGEKKPAVTIAVVPPQQSPVLLAKADVGPKNEAVIDGSNVPQTETAKTLTRTHPYVEAFDWSTPIDSGSSEALTRESTDGTESGWSIASAPSHWSTLHWVSGKSVPVISKNAVLLLSKISPTPVTIQSGTGMVFGKVPSGWTVELSGRAERPVVLGQDNRPVGAEATEGDRYFAFLNTEPGAHLIYLVGSLGKASGAVAVPVMPETATFVDLSVVTKKTVSGRVLDASAAALKALGRVQVRVIGQANATAMSNDRGEFSIPNVSVISNYPLFVETEATAGYTHRYKVSSGRERDITLFRMGEKQIAQWLDQLEGGISAASGMIVAAVPGAVDASPEHAVFPTAESLVPNATLKPETYSLSTSGQLQVNTPLKPDSSRFLSVQVPEGPAIVRLEDQRQATVWSELIVSQPGIVNVVSAY
ncbi:MAG TPA: hypothetical protein VM598_09890 [Bdellovibrionota bacterium]|nr:hypothetical protein [Bdellovibrionota bacterium]